MHNLIEISSAVKQLPASGQGHKALRKDGDLEHFGCRERYDAKDSLSPYSAVGAL
jgi:hypothetical protein